MKRVLKFLRLSLKDQYLYLESVLFLGVIRLGLLLLPFKVLRLMLAKMAPPAVNSLIGEEGTIRRIARAVRTASRYIPAATCLPQALAVYVLARRRGYAARLHLGVTKDQNGELQAHAWVESREAVVIGSLADLPRFTPMPQLW